MTLRELPKEALERGAVVYVRQSTPQQVLENRESADLQYQLRSRTVQLGWPEGRVLVIDEDQGQSGQSIDNRVVSEQCVDENAAFSRPLGASSGARSYLASEKVDE